MLLPSLSSSVKRQTLSLTCRLIMPRRCLMNRTRLENRGLLPFKHESMRFSMRTTATTCYEHTNTLLAEPAVKRSIERTIDRNVTADVVDSTLLSTLWQKLPFRRAACCCVVLHCLSERKNRSLHQDAWLSDLAKLTGLGCSTCGSHSWNQEVVLKCDWWSHVTAFSW